MFQLYPYPYLPLLPQIIMYIGVFITLVYMLYRYQKDSLSILLILMFYPGLWGFLGHTVENAMKVVVLGTTLWCILSRRALKFTNMRDTSFVGIFGVFVITYFISVSNSTNNTFTIIFSQLARYVEFFCLYFLLRDAVYKRNQSQQLLRLFYEIVFIQIIISVLKFIIFQGSQIESLVGTVAIIGGEMGTLLPILGFIVLYFYHDGKLNKWDWVLFVAGLLLIGYTTGKRAIWFILPVVIMAFLVYVKGIKLNKYLILGLCAAPIVFYFGARLTPSLNPEHKVWGSFDWDYVFGYAEEYQFGEKGLDALKMEEDVQISSMGGQLSTSDGVIEARGRGNATIALVELLFSPRYALSDQDIYGLGFSSMYSTDYGTFEKLPLTINLAYKGAATGVFQSYVTTGYVGVFTTILLMFLPFFFFKHKRLRWVILTILAWEYFMYTGMLFRTPACMAVMLFILHYANKQYEDYQAVKRASKAQQLAERKAHRKQLLEAAEAATT